MRLGLGPLVFLAAFVVAAGAGALVLGASSGHEEFDATSVLWVVVAWAFALAGLIGWWRRPYNLTGPLMVAFGLSLLASSLVTANASVPYTVGLAIVVLPYAFLFHLLLVFPTGRFERGFHRLLAAVAYINVVALQFLQLLFADPTDWGCRDCPENALQVRHVEAAGHAIEAVAISIAVVLSLALVAILARRWYSASQASRRILWPVLLTGGLTGLLLSAFLILEHFAPGAADTYGPAFFVALGSVAFAFLWGLIRSRLARAAVGELLVELRTSSAPGELRDSLSRALGDPSLRLGYWRPEPEGFVDLEGTPLELPGGEGEQVTTLVERDGHRVAVLIHDASLQGEPELLDAVCAAAGLALENERLQAELRARLEELRASRARIVETADAERRRIERNLHDGAQQRLVALSLTQRMAQSALTASPESVEALLEEASGELALAIDELRELARGIHPAILSDRGLEPALEALCARGPVPVELEVTLPDRLPGSVEAAAYYTVSEALTNVAKYAEASRVMVSVADANGFALIEVADDGVGGADQKAGSGLRGLTDRVEALDGVLAVTSPPGEGTTVLARIPLQ